MSSFIDLCETITTSTDELSDKIRDLNLSLDSNINSKKYWQNMYNSLDHEYSEKIMELRAEIDAKDKIISDYGWEESARNGGIQGQH